MPTSGIPNYALNNLFKVPQGEMALDSAHIFRGKRRQKSDPRLKETSVYNVEPSLPFKLIFPH